MTLMLSAIALVFAAGAIWRIRESAKEEIFFADKFVDSIRDENTRFLDKIEPRFSELDDLLEELIDEVEKETPTCEKLQTQVNELKRDTMKNSSSLRELNESIPQKLRDSKTRAYR